MEVVRLVVLILLAVAAVGGLFYFFWKREQARRAAWAKWAADRGWTYSHERDRDIAKYFEFVERFGRGRKRYAVDVLRGDVDGRDAIAFTYHYETRSGGKNKNTTDHYVWMVALSLERAFPELLISPENFIKRFVHTFSGSDIDFESIEFSRNYEVKCADKKFAYDFCNSRMIEMLLANPKSVIELEGQWLVTYGEGRLQLEQVDNLSRWLNHVRSLMPEFLFRRDHLR